MNAYTIVLNDDSGCCEEHEIEAANDREAKIESRNSVQELANDWCAGGEWGSDGAIVDIRWSLSRVGDTVDSYPVGGLEFFEEIDDGTVTVEIEPDHRALILEAGPWEESCGLDPGDHEWTTDGEGGCDSNPGVWSTGGTSMKFSSRCRACGLHRTEHHTGSQRNPGEHDTVEYEFLDYDNH